MSSSCSQGKPKKRRTRLGKVEELSRLNEDGRHIVVEMKVVVQSMQGDVRLGKCHKLYKIGIRLASFIKGKFF